nr:retrotransposon protein, putative, Ty3-gypsy subclass [Tanacetum cinerariifolium]
MLQQPEIPVWKQEMITMDFVSGFPRTSSGYDTIWVIVDRLTTSAHFLTMKKTDTMEKLMQLYLKEIVCRHGVPISIILDRSNAWSKRKDYANAGRYVACLSPVCWSEVGDSQLTGLKLIQEMTEKIVQFKNHLLTTRSRQKSYADRRSKSLEFEVRDMVLLKILAKVGPVAYTLELPEELKWIHKPTEIVDREVKQLKQSQIPIVKVRWNSQRSPEFTWECEDQIKNKYPHLFTINDEAGKSG